MSSGAKIFYLNEQDQITHEYLNMYVGMFHKDTQLIPTAIKISRGKYMEFARNSYTVVQTLEAGKKYAMHLVTAFGFLPILPVDEEKMVPYGFITVEDAEFDEKFEQIMLKDQV